VREFIKEQKTFPIEKLLKLSNIIQIIIIIITFTVLLVYTNIFTKPSHQKVLKLVLFSSSVILTPDTSSLPWYNYETDNYGTNNPRTKTDDESAPKWDTIKI